LENTLYKIHNLLYRDITYDCGSFGVFDPEGEFTTLLGNVGYRSKFRSVAEVLLVPATNLWYLKHCVSQLLFLVAFLFPLKISIFCLFGMLLKNTHITDATAFEQHHQRQAE
jgi:hypothetical protein